MSQKLNTAITAVGIDIGKNSFHVVGLDQRGAIVLRQRWSRGQVEARFANMPPCLIGMEACVGAHHLSRKLKSLGHDARLMPAKYVRPYSKGQKLHPRLGPILNSQQTLAGMPGRALPCHLRTLSPHSAQAGRCGEEATLARIVAIAPGSLSQRD
jgi:hypothetical protein